MLMRRPELLVIGAALVYWREDVAGGRPAHGLERIIQLPDQAYGEFANITREGSLACFEQQAMTIDCCCGEMLQHAGFSLPSY